MTVLGIPISIPFFRSTGGGLSLSTEYQAVYDVMTNQPTAADAVNQDTWLTGMVDDGVYAEADALYMMATHTNDDGEAQINWKNPGTHDLTLVNGPTFTAYQGFECDGSTSYLDTNYNPTSHAVNYAQNDCSGGVFSRKISTKGANDFGVLFGVYFFIQLDSDNTNIAYIHKTFAMTWPAEDSIGYWIISRTASNDAKAYRGNVQKATSAVASNGIPNGNNFIGCRNNNGSPFGFADREYSSAFLGGALDSTARAGIEAKTEAYLDNYGKGVL